MLGNTHNGSDDVSVHNEEDVLWYYNASDDVLQAFQNVSDGKADETGRLMEEHTAWEKELLAFFEERNRTHTGSCLPLLQWS